MTHAHLENSGQAKYKSVLKSLNSQQSLKNNQFPKTIADRNNVLSNYCFNNAKKISKEFKKNSGNSRNSCKKGNKKKEEDTTLLTFTQLKKVCYICGDSRYLVNKYSKRSKTNQ